MSIMPFDFRRPEKMSKEYGQSLRMLQTTFARQLSGSLSTLLRSVVQVELHELTEMSYEDYLATLSSDSLMAVCGAPPLDGKLLFVVDPELSLVLVDRLMGGQGDTPTQVRGMTEIELVLVQQVIRRVLACMKEAWASVIEVAPVIDQLETSPHFVQLVPGSDAVVAVTFAVSLRTSRSFLRLCLPYHLLKPLMPRLHEQLWFFDHGKPAEGANTSPAVERHLLATPVTIKVELGEAVLTVAELLDLQVGDCVVLDRRENEDISVLVAGERQLRGHLGVVGQQYAVAITRWETAVASTPGVASSKSGGEQS